MQTNARPVQTTKKNSSESVQEFEVQVVKPMSNAKKTMVTSAISLALLGAGQIPMQALRGGAEPPTLAQTRGDKSDERALDERALKEYFRKDFNYVDAKILAAYWGGNAGEAKIRMGNKILNFGMADAIGLIREARGLALERSTVYADKGQGVLGFMIDYTDAGYTDAEMVALAKFWDKSALETKMMMDTMLISGKDKDLKAALQNATK
jgi:hypothetical protein